MRQDMRMRLCQKTASVGLVLGLVRSSEVLVSHVPAQYFPNGRCCVALWLHLHYDNYRYVA